MVTIPDRLRALVSGHIVERNGTTQIEIPEELIDQSTIDLGEVYQVAVLATETEDSADGHQKSPSASGTQASSSTVATPEPPVTEGEVRTVTIDTLGDQGDGITRVERGFVVIVADAEPDEEVTVEIDTVQSNVAFASIVERGE